MNSIPKDNHKKFSLHSGIFPYIIGILFGILIAIGGLLIIFSSRKSPSYPTKSIAIENLDSLIHINQMKDIKIVRKRLIAFIWEENELPNRLPDEIDVNINDIRYINMEKLEHIDMLTIDMKHGINSIVYIFHPDESTNRLIIYHQGHEGDIINGFDTIQFFLNQGFTVIAFSMPLLGMNNQPIVNIAEFGPIALVDHDRLKFLDNPIQFFLEPISIGLNYLEEEFNFDIIAMTGISGGGWTTQLYSAIDPRVTNSYPVAGSLPIYLRSIGNEWGDFEQSEPKLYKVANYLDLYILAASNGKQIQILNKYDPCCFGGNRNLSFEKLIQERAERFDGTFSIIIDDSHRKHEISNRTLNLILSDLEKENPN